MPPLVGVAVKVTLVPVQIVCAPTVIAVDTEGVTDRQIVVVYVFRVAPSCAVTFTSIVLLPSFKDKAADAVPLVTVT